MEVSSQLSFFLFLFIFLLRPTAEGSLFPSTMDYHHQDDLFRLDNWLPDPFKVLEHLPIGFERDDEVMISSARADWKETPQSHLITLDVPGFRKDELKIEESNGVLRVSGEKKRSEEEANTKTHWHCLERSYGKFIRQFRLPKNVDLDSVNAKLENGVLTISIAKLSLDLVKGPKVIPVSAGATEEQPQASSTLTTAASTVKEEL